MWNRHISTADGFRYLAGAILALIIVFTIASTDRESAPTFAQAALFYPPAILLTAALFAPRRLRFVLRIATGLGCGAALGASVYGLVVIAPNHPERGNVFQFVKLAFWGPVFAGGLWWAITGRVAPWMSDEAEAEQTASP